MSRYACSLTRDEARAQDVVQSALVRVMERGATFEQNRPLTPWLLAIVRNVFLSDARRQAAEARRDAVFARELVERCEAGQDQAIHLQQVARRFAALPEPFRETLHLVAVEDLSYAEAASVLGVPAGTVMSRLSRARALMREGEAGSAANEDRRSA